MLKNVIPFVDLRGKTPVDLLRAYPDKIGDIINQSRGAFGKLGRKVSYIALPLGDWRSRSWLKRSKNPFRYEIESMADILGISGIYALNLSYEWGCTTASFRTGETVSMLRMLDWPFPGLGRHAMVVLQSGKIGDFYNITWPGLSGVFTGMAPGRFAVAINQGPMRKHGLGFAGDWVRNRFIVDREMGLPPSHLLRQVMETAPGYETAKDMLTRTPVACPVIFVLSGIKLGQGCVIERLENAAEVFDLSAGQQVTASNQFHSGFANFGRGWRPREIDSAGRYRQCAALAGHDLSENSFSWLRPPIINAYTRLGVITDAATGRLVVQGFEGPMPVTEPFILPGTSEVRVPAAMEF